MKTALILAPIIVATAALWLAFWAGRKTERVKQKLVADRIDVGLHNDLIELVRRILSPADLDQVAFLPDPVAARARELLAQADENTTAVQAAKRRQGDYY